MDPQHTLLALCTHWALTPPLSPQLPSMQITLLRFFTIQMVELPHQIQLVRYQGQVSLLIQRQALQKMVMTLMDGVMAPKSLLQVLPPRWAPLTQL